MGELFGILLLAWSPVVSAHEPLAGEIPYWARRYGVSCTQCHSSVPRLNRFGAEFLARGYQLPPDTNVQPRRTVPLAVWVSGRSESRPPSALTGEHVRAYLNRVELISGGPVVARWLSYFVEWRPVSQEARGDGTLRDRSGRFEDVFLTASSPGWALTIGQFRQLDQVDVSRRLGISEPLTLSASLAGTGAGSARERALRAFAPAARSPAVRLTREQRVGGWRWTTLAAGAVPGELSIPLNDEARVEASNEIEWRPKGIYAESHLRSGPASFGAHVFYDDGRRYLAQGLATGRLAPSFFWTGVAGVAKTGDVLRGRWSLEAEYIPLPLLAVGGRVEDRAGDGAEPAFLPYANVSLPATSYTFRLTIEHRVQRGRDGTFVELGAVF